MLDSLKALFLGIVQGLTEFLPVSSSGHLEILNYLWPSSSELGSDLFMVVLVHFGTALSILYVFREDILKIITSILTWKRDEHFYLAWKIVLSTIPALIVGLTFEKQIDALFEGSIRYVAVFLICTGLILWFLPRLHKDSTMEISWRMAFLIGLAQAVAILPGISRSGATIACALALGAAKPQAARFSFLMVLPILLGKMLLDILDGGMNVDTARTLNFSIAMFSAFVVGVFACKWMISLVSRTKLHYFSYYCVAVGLLVLIGTWL